MIIDDLDPNPNTLCTRCKTLPAAAGIGALGFCMSCITDIKLAHTLPDTITRVVLVEPNGHYLEHFADQWDIHIQDQGRTIKLFAKGDGQQAQTTRNTALATDLGQRPEITDEQRQLITKRLDTIDQTQSRIIRELVQAAYALDP